VRNVLKVRDVQDSHAIGDLEDSWIIVAGYPDNDGTFAD